MDIALAASALTKVILQIAVSSGGAPNRLDGPRRKRRPPEIGVENYPGSIDHLSQRGLPASLEPLSDSFLDAVTYVAAPLRRRSVVPEAIANGRAGFPEALPNFSDHQFSGVRLEPLFDARSTQQVIHRGKVLVLLLSLHRLHVPIATPPRERRQRHRGSLLSLSERGSPQRFRDGPRLAYGIKSNATLNALSRAFISSGVTLLIKPRRRD